MAKVPIAQTTRRRALTNEDVEHQLRQLKQALMTLAMDQKARVAASGWTDRNGALNEDLMVFSGLALEKLRPNRSSKPFWRGNHGIGICS
jgi:hypothetical protein